MPDKKIINDLPELTGDDPEKEWKMLLEYCPEDLKNKLVELNSAIDYSKLAEVSVSNVSIDKKDRRIDFVLKK